VGEKWWSVLFGVVLAAAFGLFVVAVFVPGWWLPHDASSYGWRVDWLYYLILILTGFFFVLTEAILVYNLWRFAARPGQKSVYLHGNHQLEWLWTTVTAVILLIVAFTQVSAWDAIKYQTSMPAPDQIFEVSARQFEWRLRYPSEERLKEMTGAWKTGSPEPDTAREWNRNPEADDVHVVNEVHIWKSTKDRPCRVRVYLKTRDVIHSFFLPNLRIKQDALPGKVIPVWFEATDHNIEWDSASSSWKQDKDKFWELACAELCGWGHSKMQGRLFVHKDYEDYKRWLDEAAARERAHEADPRDKPQQ
jgi:cytochrome c oxidase subunit II